MLICNSQSSFYVNLRQYIRLKNMTLRFKQNKSSNIQNDYFGYNL